MFAGLGRLVHRRRWISLFLCLVMAVVGGGWGLGVFQRFKQGGFEDPKASSTYVYKLSATYLGSTNPDVLVLYRSDTTTVDDPDYMANVLTTVARLPKSQVASVLTYWNGSKPLDQFVSNDRRSTFVAIKVQGDTEATKTANYFAIKDALQAPGLNTRIGGGLALGVEFGEQTMADIVNAERMTILPLLVLLVMLFGALTASLLPIIVALFSIAGGFAVLNAVTYVTDVSSFALEVVTMMGVGLAIDYSLFIISRFREELAAGRDRETALSNTMATAGKTIAFSGITVTTALGGLLLFPQMFLRSIGLGGMAVVLVSMFGATVLLPAMLAVLGHRVEWGRMPWRRREKRPGREEHAFWYRLGHSVMRRPFPYFLVVLTVLGVLFVPFLNVQFGSVDARVLPKDSVSRGVVETVKREFPGQTFEPIDVVITGDLVPRDWTPGKSKVPPFLEEFRKKLASMPHVTGATFTGISTEATVVRISVTSELDPMDERTQDLVRQIRGMKIASDREGPRYVDVGGSTAAQMDLMRSLTKTLPLMGLVVGTMTFLLLFAAFGSIFLPAKAIIMNILSIGASFGVIVWGFQYGHLAGILDFTPTGGVEATSMILVLAVVFGLSMDYEVFLLSRIREEWDRTGDNRAAVAKGMQSTGSIITSAALLFLVVIAGFAFAGITVVKLIGVGMFVAVVVDATLVRSLLVPATMRFMGAANWWLPGPLARLHRHVDLRESAHVPEARDAAHVGDHHGGRYDGDPQVSDPGADRFVEKARRSGEARTLHEVGGVHEPEPRRAAYAMDDLDIGDDAGVAYAVAKPAPVVRNDVVHRPARRSRLGKPAQQPADVRQPPADVRQPSGQFAEWSASSGGRPGGGGQPDAPAGRLPSERRSERRPGEIPRWEGPKRPEPRQHPPIAREIMPSPDGSGWRWRTPDDENAS